MLLGARLSLVVEEELKNANSKAFARNERLFGRRGALWTRITSASRISPERRARHCSGEARVCRFDESLEEAFTLGEIFTVTFARPRLECGFSRARNNNNNNSSSDSKLAKSRLICICIEVPRASRQTPQRWAARRAEINSRSDLAH